MRQDVVDVQSTGQDDLDVGEVAPRPLDRIVGRTEDDQGPALDAEPRQTLDHPLRLRLG